MMTMYAPSSFPNGSKAQVGDGTLYTVASGTISAKEMHLKDLLALGFSESGTTLDESAATGITAFAGGGQANATPLTAQINRVTTVATAGDSVMLPPSSPGLWVVLINRGANPMQVFGAGTDTINGVAAATGLSQMPNSVDFYVCAVAGAWETEGTAIGFAGSLETNSAVNNLTAFAGGGQASATPLTAMINRVVTVATAGDSTKLPTSAVGMTLMVANAHATNSMNVFPNTGESINALAANAAFAVLAGKVATFYCANVGQWHTLLSA